MDIEDAELVIEISITTDLKDALEPGRSSGDLDEVKVVLENLRSFCRVDILSARVVEK